MNRSQEILGSNVDRAEAVVYDGDEALANMQGLLEEEEERRVRRRCEPTVTHFAPRGDGPFRRRPVQLAASHIVSDVVPACIRGAEMASIQSTEALLVSDRGAGVRSWFGFEQPSAVLASSEPNGVQRRPLYPSSVTSFRLVSGGQRLRQPELHGADLRHGQLYYHHQAPNLS